MLTSSITQKGQITIPKIIRQELRLKTSDKVVFVHRRNEIVIKPLKNIFSLRGIIPVNKKQKFEQIREITLEKTAKRIADE